MWYSQLKMSFFKSPNYSLYKIYSPKPLQVISFLFGRYKKGNIPPKVPKDFVYPNIESSFDSGKESVMWINHSTYLVEASGKFFLTDPIWSKRCSPLRCIGPKRHSPPPFSLDELPPIFAVIISHNHYDHLDYQTVRRLHKLFPMCHWILPFGLKGWYLRHFPDFKSGYLHELHWGEQVNCEDVSFLSMPAQHFSGRHLFDTNKTFWMGCLVKVRNKSFYFVGDSGYNSLIFNEIGKNHGPIDLSLIPIGTYLPRDFMKHVHVNPEEAVKIHCEVGSKLSVGGHFGTFNLSYEPPCQPPYDLYHALQKENIPWESFRILKPGQKINW